MRFTAAEIRVLREAARQLHGLAENDRDSGHVDRGFRRTLVGWAKAKLPGWRAAADAAEMLTEDEDR